MKHLIPTLALLCANVVWGQTTLTRFTGPTSSQPLALSANGAFLVVANPDNHTASFFDLRLDRNRKVAEVPVQKGPNGAAFLPDGPRRTISQHTDLDLTDPSRTTQRALNWLAVRDEEEDFELNIRAVSGGVGLIVQADGVSQEPAVKNFAPLASGGRNQVKIRGENAWDAIKAYVQFGIRPPISPAIKTNPDVIAGEALFRSANCQQCHGGPQWTSARVRFTPPPPAAQVVNGQLINELRQVGTFNAADFNEVNQLGNPALGAGFAPPSLLSVFSVPELFLHGGAAPTLGDVLNNVTHRAAGTGGVDTLSNAADRNKIVEFLKSIDAATPPILP